MPQKVRSFYYTLFGGALAVFPLLARGAAVQSSGWGAGRTNAQSAGLPGGSLYGIISSTFSWLLAVLGFVAIAGFVISGILYLTAAGSESQIDQAKNAAKYSLIGVIVALGGYVIVQAVEFWLNEDIAF